MSNSDSPEGSTSPIRQWTELGQYTELSDHMSVKELSLWLKTVGEIPDTFCQIIAGQSCKLCDESCFLLFCYWQELTAVYSGKLHMCRSL